MSFTHGKGTRTFINTTECSAFLNSIEQSISREMSETSVFGSAVKTYTKGLRDSTITLSGYWDGATDAIDAVMNRLFENVNLLPPGDAVANYTNVSNVTNAGTPISGFAASIQFGDNGANREATKAPPEIVANAVYNFYAVVQMDDNSVPVPFLNMVTSGDFNLGPIVYGTNVSVFSGSAYRVQKSLSFVDANYNGIPIGRILKNSFSTAKPFRAAGLTLEATNLPNAISILDEGNTLGAKALVASAKATSYQVTNAVGDTVAVSAEFQVDGSGNAANSVTEQNLFPGSNDIPLASYISGGSPTNSPGGISGFVNSVEFPNNSVTRYIVRVLTIPTQTFATFSCYMKMNDDSVPVIGRATDATADANLFMNNGGASSTLTNGVVTNVYGSVYRVSFTAPTGSSGSTQHGVAKNTTNSAKGFKVTAFEIFIPRLPTGAFRGQVLAPLAVRGNNSTSTALDNGAGTTNGMAFNIHMLNNAATTQVVIQHSPDGSTWADLFASYQTASIKFAQSGATVGPVNRYLRTLVTTSGSPQILVTAARR
jgi:hypothetical protein